MLDGTRDQLVTWGGWLIWANAANQVSCVISLLKTNISNILTFEALRYGINEMLKLATSYTAPNGYLISEKDHICEIWV